MYRSTLIAILLGLSLSTPQDLSSSVDSLKSEIEKNPGSPELHFSLANCYYGLGEYTNAIQEFQRALDLKPDCFSARFKLALCYYHVDSIDVARIELERVRDIQPANKHPYLWLGDVYGLLGLYDEMLTSFKEYRRLAGKDFFHGHSTRDYFDVEDLIAKSYAMQGQSDSAIEYYRSAIDDYWGPYHYDIMLAVIYAREGESSKAEKWLAKGMEHLKRYYHYRGGNEIRDFGMALLRTKAIWLWLLGYFDRSVALLDSLGLITELDTVDIYNKCVFKISAGDANGVEDLKQAAAHLGRFSILFDVLMLLRADSLSEAMSVLNADKEYLNKSGLGRGLYAYILEELGYKSQAVKWWYRSYGNLPLGADVESMRHFMKAFVATARRIRQ